MRAFLLVVGWCFLMLFGQRAALAAGCSSKIAARSGPATVTILELYTSEGCDSCPPADRWFSGLDHRKDGVVPLAFHVDYWDYIGWKDHFAKPAFTQRQRDTVRRQGGRTTYTPQVMLDGRDAGLWSYQAGVRSRLSEIAARAPRAEISVGATHADHAIEIALQVRVPALAERAESALFVAITEDKLASRVTAGENRGLLLNHDHVVRELVGPIGLNGPASADGSLAISRTIALPPDWKGPDLSLVAFVQNMRSGEVLQAIMAPFCPR